MKQLFRQCLVALALAALAPPGSPAFQQQEGERDREQDVRLPNGKLQKDAILKADHDKNLKDAAALVSLAEELQQELEKNEHFVLSVSSIRRTEEIEKLAKRIRGRMRRF